MKKFIALFLLASITGSASAEVVNGHFRSNGTYVNPYLRSPANNTTIDNYSYRPRPANPSPNFTDQRSYTSPQYQTRPNQYQSTQPQYNRSRY